jgi:hypothetical protein
MEYLLTIMISIVVAAGVALLCDWRWPGVSLPRLTVIAGLVPPIFLILLGLILAFLALGEECPPGDACDAGAMVVAALIGLAGEALVITLVSSLAASYLTLRFLRSA